MMFENVADDFDMEVQDVINEDKLQVASTYMRSLIKNMKAMRSSMDALVKKELTAYVEQFEVVIEKLKEIQGRSPRRMAHAASGETKKCIKGRKYDTRCIR